MAMARIAIRLENDPQLKPEDYHELATLAESCNYEAVWVPEGAGRDSPTLLAAMAMVTRQVKLATGILPVFTRTPMTFAMTAAGLSALSHGRFMLGLGVGHRASVESGQGVPFVRPVSRLRDTIHIVRGLLQGKSVTYQGRTFKVSNATLGAAAPAGKVPIYIAALGPQMLEMAGELADGVLLNWTAAGYLEQAIEHVRSGAVKAGRDPGEIDIAGYVRVAVVDDERPARESLSRQIVRYAGNPFYGNFFRETGFAREMAQVDAALQRGDAAAAADAVTREMQDQVAAVGTPAECARAIEARRDRGLQLPVVAPFPVGDPRDDYRRAIAAFSGQTT
jgi:5,10-methylenetetrahydromethanopterin reductase